MITEAEREQLATTRAKMRLLEQRAAALAQELRELDAALDRCNKLVMKEDYPTQSVALDLHLRLGALTVLINRVYKRLYPL